MSPTVIFFEFTTVVSPIIMLPVSVIVLIPFMIAPAFVAASTVPPVILFVPLKKLIPAPRTVVPALWLYIPVYSF